MKPSQIPSSHHETKATKRGNFSLDRTTKRTHTIQAQQSYPLNHTPFLTTNAISRELANLNSQTLSQVSRSEVFVCSYATSKDQPSSSQANASHNYIFGNFNNKEIFKNTRESPTDILAKRSVQILIGLNQGMIKAQYSKITRRKEEFPKKSTITSNQILQNRVESAQEEKLIEKYRQLLQNKEKPFNMINKLYQLELLTTKQAIIEPKTGFKATAAKLNSIKKTNIEDKVHHFSQKSKTSDRIKDMLLCGSEKFISKEAQQKNATLTNFNPTRQPYSQERYKQVRPLRQMRSKILKLNQSIIQKVQPPLKVIELKINQSNSRKTQLFGTAHESPSKRQKAPSPPIPKKISSSAFLVYQIADEKAKSASKRSQPDSVKKREIAGKVHAASNIRSASQIASLTKIMTCIVTIQICQRLSVNPHQQKYKTGQFESVIRGTTAEIEAGEIYSIHQLLHGLMLPSGNDASLALARWGGNTLLLADSQGQKRKNQEKEKTLINQPWLAKNKFMRFKEDKLKYKRCYNRFIAEMNKKARMLGLERTSYVNSHGLSNPHNKSCCLDLALLCEHAMLNPYFRSIVGCKQYEAVIEKLVVSSEPSSAKKRKGRSVRSKASEDPEQMNLLQDAEDDVQMNKSDDQDWEETQTDLQADLNKQESQAEIGLKTEAVIIQKQIKWTNTHRLLHKTDAYLGIKTGVTTTAGACLASYLTIKDRSFVIIVLNSKKLSLRFTDTQLLRQWLARKENLWQSQPKQDCQSDILE